MHPFHARYSEPHGGRIGAVRSPGVFDVLSRRNDLDRRQRADHRRAAGHRRSGAGRRRSRTRTSQGSRGGRPRRRLPDAVLRRRTRPPAARWPRGGRAAGAAVQVGRRDRRRGEEIRRRASRRRVDRRRLLREQHGFWRAVRRALARRCGRRPARRAAGVGLPHGVVQQRCARAGSDHRRYPGSGARRDSAPRGWFAAGHATRVGRRRPAVQGGAGARSEGARRGTAHGRRILLGGRCDLGTGRVGGACRRRHLHRRRPPRRARPPVQPRPLRRPPLLRRPTRPLRRRASPRPRDSLAAAHRQYRQVLRGRGHRERNRGTAGAVLRLASQPRHAGLGQPRRRGTRRRRTRVPDPHPRNRRCGRTPGAGCDRACRRHQRTTRPATGDRARAAGRRYRPGPLRRIGRDPQHATAVGTTGSADGRADHPAARARPQRQAVPHAQPRRIGSAAGVRLRLAGVLWCAVGRDRHRGVTRWVDAAGAPHRRAGADRLHRGSGKAGLRRRAMGHNHTRRQRRSGVVGLRSACDAAERACGCPYPCHVSVRKVGLHGHRLKGIAMSTAPSDTPAATLPLTVFTTYGIVTQTSGGRLSVSYLITLAAMVFTARSYARMAAAYPVAGSTYAYTQRTFGPPIGFLAGWSLLLDYLFLPMLNYLVIGIYLNAAIPAVPAWVFVLITIAIVTVLNIIGIVSVARANLLIIVMQAVFIVVFLVLA